MCLSSTDGQIIGGGVGGPLKAAGPVQVLIWILIGVGLYVFLGEELDYILVRKM